MLGFGIIPASAGVSYIPLKFFAAVGSAEELYSTLQAWTPTGDMMIAVEQYQQKTKSRRVPGISDMLCMVCPFLRIRGTTVNRIHRPTEYSFGPLYAYSGHNAFFVSLYEYAESPAGQNSTVAEVMVQHSLELESMYKQQEEWARDDDAEPYAQYPNADTLSSLTFLEALHDEAELMESWIAERRLAGPATSSKKEDLVQAIIVQHFIRANEAAAARSIEWSALRPTQQQYYVAEVTWHFKNLHSLSDPFTTIADKQVIVDLWLCLMYRAICWAKAHYIERDTPHATVPARYWGSELPVYIG